MVIEDDVSRVIVFSRTYVKRRSHIEILFKPLEKT